MTETQLKVQVKRYLFSIGAAEWKLSDRFTSGLPDLLIVYKGVTLFIELKTPKGVVSKIQTWTINKINANGGHAYVCRSLGEVKEIINEIDNGSRGSKNSVGDGWSP